MNRTETPPGGWLYYEAALNWSAPTPIASTFSQTVDLIRKQRQANPAKRLSTDWETIARELENFTRRRLHLPRQFGNEDAAAVARSAAFRDCTMNGWTVQGPNLTWAQVEACRKAGERLPLYIHAHPCTGDHIICCGLYRVLAKQWQINLFVRHGDQGKVGLLFKGFPDTRFIPAGDLEMEPLCDRLRDAVVLRLGDYSRLPFDHNNFDVDFYAHAGVDFRHRWDSFHAPNVPQVPVPMGEYTFVHDRPEVGAKLTMDGHRPLKEASIFAHRDLILGASALHCVSSSFAAFADCFDLSGKSLNFYPHGREIPTHRNNWKLWK